MRKEKWIVCGNIDSESSFVEAYDNYHDAFRFYKSVQKDFEEFDDDGNLRSSERVFILAKVKHSSDDTA